MSGRDYHAPHLKRCVKTVESALSKLGLDPGQCFDDELTEEGPANCVTWNLSKGDGEVFILLWVDEGDVCLEVRSLVVRMPDENLLPLYRRLLELNAEEVRGAAFGLSGEFVVLSIDRGTEGIMRDHVIEMIVAVADYGAHFRSELLTEFGCLSADDA